MNAILVLLLLAQPDPEESARVVQHLVTQLGEASQLAEDNPDEALRLLNMLLDDPRTREDRSPTVRALRDQALYIRGHIQIRQGQAQVVANDMTAVLDGKRNRFSARVAGLVGQLASPLADGSLGASLNFPPAAPLSRMDFLSALVLRAQVYGELGQHDKEEADRAETMEIMREMMQGVPVISYQPPHQPPEWMAWSSADFWEQVSLVTGSLFIAGTFVVMVPVFFLMGLRQRRDGGGTWRRLLWVSLALAALQTAPVFAAFLLLRWWPESSYAPGLLFVTSLVPRPD